MHAFKQYICLDPTQRIAEKGNYEPVLEPRSNQAENCLVKQLEDSNNKSLNSDSKD